MRFLTGMSVASLSVVLSACGGGGGGGSTANPGTPPGSSNDNLPDSDYILGAPVSYSLLYRAPTDYGHDYEFAYYGDKGNNRDPEMIWDECKYSKEWRIKTFCDNDQSQGVIRPESPNEYSGYTRSGNAPWTFFVQNIEDKLRHASEGVNQIVSHSFIEENEGSEPDLSEARIETQISRLPSTQIDSQQAAALVLGHRWYGKFDYFEVSATAPDTLEDAFRKTTVILYVNQDGHNAIMDRVEIMGSGTYEFNPPPDTFAYKQSQKDQHFNAVVAQEIIVSHRP